jgi:hypothetical protein
MNEKVIINQFKNIGFAQYAFTEEELKPIRQEVSNIQNNFNNYTTSNHKLVGNIAKEFYIKESLDNLEKLILPLISAYDQFFNYTQSIDFLKQDYPITLDTAWVNFQSKGEFNPNHVHNGIFSFVLYIQVPYLIQDEIKMVLAYIQAKIFQGILSSHIQTRLAIFKQKRFQ